MWCPAYHAATPCMLQLLRCSAHLMVLLLLSLGCMRAIHLYQRSCCSRVSAGLHLTALSCAIVCCACAGLSLCSSTPMPRALAAAGSHSRRNMQLQLRLAAPSAPPPAAAAPASCLAGPRLWCEHGCAAHPWPPPHGMEAGLSSSPLHAIPSAVAALNPGTTLAWSWGPAASAAEVYGACVTSQLRRVEAACRPRGSVRD